MVAKFGSVERRIKKDKKEDEIFQNNSWCTLFEHKRKEGILEEMKVEQLE
jgi:hypothetical protein